MTELLGFIAASLLIIVVPGPDLALLLGNTARSGQRAGVATAAGIMLGHAVLAAAAVAGLTALLTASEIGYAAVRLAGAFYLIHLGLKALIGFVRMRRSSAERRTAGHDARPARAVTGRTMRVCVRQGLISNLLNPKVAAFYLSLFPQFVLPGMSTTANQSTLAGVFWVLCLLWFALVLTLLARIRALLRRPGVEQGLAGVSGVSLIGLGTALALRG
ncbi:LysE family translocator [Streptomyces drozdowiczii]|uniref:LysE family translocator n=1 Tax=Streptomyces drozdowiczii TaxID=202862 RepID=A0ABY6PNB6_9ACTN|nr:LysE family translocator [Streptomyces drozdowiczii]MCX0246848.1 LysE family translocator [Streptomyces drozdowiczii]UZK53698.1 LysE family translocator [Streptomyces drozdowiczii]